MNEFWIQNVYLLYVFAILAVGYFGFTFKRALKSFDEWKQLIIEEIKTIKKNQIELRLSLPEKYVLCKKYENDIKEIKELLQKIFDKLDTKADKL